LQFPRDDKVNLGSAPTLLSGPRMHSSRRDLPPGAHHRPHRRRQTTPALDEFSCTPRTNTTDLHPGTGIVDESRICPNTAPRTTDLFLSTRSALRCPPNALPATPPDPLSVKKCIPRTNTTDLRPGTGIVDESRICPTTALRTTDAFQTTRSVLRCPPKCLPATPPDPLLLAPSRALAAPSRDGSTSLC